MRVLITTDVVGGVWHFTLSLVRRLRASGHDCLVAMIGAPDAAQLEELPEGVEHRFRDLRLEWMQDAEHDVAAAADWLQELSADWRPDLVHLNQFAYGDRDYGVPTLLVAHSDVRSWWGEVMQRPAPQEWDGYTALVRRGLAGVDAVVAPTAYQSGLLARHYGRPADLVIHNGTESPGLPPDLRPASRRPLMMTAGRAWDEAKAVQVLDDAVELLGEDAPLVELAGALEGPDGRTYVPRRLQPLGELTRAEMTRLYHNLWNGCAEFYSAGNPASLAGALRRMLDDAQRVDRLAESARERARDRYGAGRMAARYEELYGCLVGAAALPSVAIQRARESGGGEPPPSREQIAS